MTRNTLEGGDLGTTLTGSSCSRTSLRASGRGSGSCMGRWEQAKDAEDNLRHSTADSRDDDVREVLKAGLSIARIQRSLACLPPASNGF